jgi:hypothetical protein
MDSVRIERLRVESQRAGLKFKIMLKAQQSKTGLLHSTNTEEKSFKVKLFDKIRVRVNSA